MSFTGRITHASGEKAISAITELNLGIDSRSDQEKRKRGSISLSSESQERKTSIESILAAKTRIPVTYDDLLERGHLKARLDEAVRKAPQLVLLCAPPGFGKTSLIADWIRSSSTEHSWLTLDSGDNDPAIFSKHLLESIRGNAVSAPPAYVSITDNPGNSAPESIGKSLISTLPDRASPFVVVLDDYHEITNPFIHEIMTVIAQQSSRSTAIVIASRVDPPLHIARMRASGRVVDIRMGDLRFTKDESIEFLRRGLGAEIVGDGIDLVTDRIEGWPAVLRLFALSYISHSGESLTELATEIAGSHGYLVDYLAEEILHRLSFEMRQFLIRTSILDIFCESLCNVLTGRKECKSILDELERLQMFLIVLDRRNGWYRYHALFSDFLSTRLPAEETVDLHTKAAGWYISHGFPNRAVRHAIEAGNRDYAEELLRSEAPKAFANGTHVLLERWLDTYRKKHGSPDKTLRLFSAWLRIFAGNTDEAGRILGEIDAEDADSDLPGKVGAKAWLSDAAATPIDSSEIAHSPVVVDRTKPGEGIAESTAFARLLFREGRTKEAADAFRRSYEHARETGASFFSPLILHDLCLTLIYAGDLPAARAFIEDYGQVRSISDEYDSLPQLEHVARAAISLQDGDARTAQRFIESALGSSTPMRAYFIRGSAAERLHAFATLGASGAAQATETISSRIPIDPDPRFEQTGWLRTLRATHAQLLTRTGQNTTARLWSTRNRWISSQTLDPVVEIERISAVESMCVDNRNDEAEALASAMRAAARESGRLGSLATIELLTAYAQHSGGRHRSAKESLQHAFEATGDDGGILPFMLYGGQLAGLLHGAQSGSLIKRIVDALYEWQTVDIAQAVSSREGLSEREIEILHHVARGLSNAEIAEELFISEGTVKWHLNNVFSKLGVKSRTQAAERARELRVL